MGDLIRVAMVRAVPQRGDFHANCDRLMQVLDQVRTCRPDVVVTPECFSDGYLAPEAGCTPDALRRCAVRDMDSAPMPLLAEWCRQQQCWLIFGCTRCTDDGVFNSAMVLDRQGRLAGTYDKIHLQQHDLQYQPGRRLPVFEGDFGRFGVMICADRRWPETARTLALRGARIVFNPTYGFHDDLNRCMMRTRAYESELYIAFTHPRQSLVTGPDGSVVLDAGEGPDCFSACQLDLSRVDQARLRPSAHLRDRAPAAYHDDQP